MNLGEALILINNLDVKAPLRKFSPQWSTVAVDKSGNIAAVIRHKERPTLALNKEHLMEYPGTVQITAWPGRFDTIEELSTAVESCLAANREY